MTQVRLEIEDLANRVTLRAMLCIEGCEIVSEGGDAIFTDKLSPNIPRYRSRPCIILCSASNVATAVEAMNNGAFGYILTPLQPGEALIALRRALEWRNSGKNIDAISSELESVSDAEERVILLALRQCHNNKSEAARLLGIGRNTLWRKLKKTREHGQDIEK
jgi:DNA-binding NtrC family response regulator